MSNNMKLIMENWRSNMYLLENVSGEAVMNFLEKSMSGKIPEERIVGTLQELTKDKEFAEAVAFFTAATSDDLEEGALQDAWNAINTQVIKAKLKGEDAMQTLQQVAPNAARLAAPILGLAFVAAMYQVKGDIDAGDIENGIKVAQKGLKGQELIDLAAQGGPLSENIKTKIN